jgi:hypothetical protein
VDLNGDGYLDIVGFGHVAIYRSLGGPNGFGGTRAMIRDLVTASGSPWFGYEDVVPTFYPRMAGDVNGDGMTDLVAFAHDEVKVVRSSDLPPPDAPKTPINAQVTAETATSLSIKWDDNSNDERRFFVFFDSNPSTGDPRSLVRPRDATIAVLNNLESNTEYCFTVHAENIFGMSAGTRRVCGTTNPEVPGPSPTPTPPASGISRVDVFNCHSEERPVYVWTFDTTQNFWVERGKVAPMWNNGSCGPLTSLPFKVPLDHGHQYWFVVVDPELTACSGNNPQDSACQRSFYTAPLLGDMNGPSLINVVN